jgi:hypothetical protein
VKSTDTFDIGAGTHRGALDNDADADQGLARFGVLHPARNLAGRAGKKQCGHQEQQEGHEHGA